MNPDLTGANDEAVITRVIDGDVNAFEYLLAKYNGHVLKIVKKHVPYDRVEEIVQEVFIRVFRSLSTFGQKSRFENWLSSIATRTCYDFWRKQYRNRELPMSSLSEEHRTWIEKTLADRSGEDFYALCSQKEAREVLDWALRQLSPEEKIVIELVHLEGAAVKEAAEQLGWSVANVKVRSFRARRKMRTILDRLVKDDGER